MSDLYTERKTTAGLLEVGQEIKRANGVFSEIIDLQAASLGGSVAIFFEEDEDPVVVPTMTKVVIR